MTADSEQKTSASKVRHRTTPVQLTHVPNYPQKLVIYRLEASSYWWVRYYIDGKIARRSTKTEKKGEAIAFAKQFYDEIMLRRASGLAVTTQSRFDICATNMLVAMKAQVARGEITEATYTITDYRLKASVLPYFGARDVADIHYEQLESYLGELSHQVPKLSLSTIQSYLKLVRKVLNYAYKRRLLQNIPHFPTVAVPDNARGYFTTVEYRKLWSRARALIGSRFEYRKLKDKDGNEQLGQYFAANTTTEGRKVRVVEITPELAELIIFVVNSYVRPTDIKNLQHKHVEIIRNEHTYLRLTLPVSKKHDLPIVTLQQAVTVYERLTAHNKAMGWGVGADDYVFFPNYEKRDYALKQLQRQFDVVLAELGLGQGAKGAERTIYSLRHTCIMYRLMYGEKVDVITLARNARTSPEMIDRFYASQLKAEDNIEMLQSKRRGKDKKN
ncbi:hypothetical protein [Azonexus fungiphilus]|uniref:hypothetical protein n=1 Tax=Azonexus fungiphilus TaxID=146940 RepID=UPI00156BCE59|nr:hypothetical protein [Azonexus fungiphilus]NHC08354.1 hypothetical protein [Azonexus fungiphilus]